MSNRQREMLWGVDAIGGALFGPEHAKEHRRTLYTLMARGALPVFKMGRTPCAFPEQIEAYLEAKAQEAASKMADAE
jgi:hypothetical protein